MVTGSRLLIAEHFYGPLAQLGVATDTSPLRRSGNFLNFQSTGKADGDSSKIRFQNTVFSKNTLLDASFISPRFSDEPSPGSKKTRKVKSPIV